jgi:hypothetical protein
MNERHFTRRPSGFRQGGAALVELAIVLPILLILAFGFTEFGRLLYQQNQLTKQVTTGARFLARVYDDEAVTGGCPPTGADWIDAQATVVALIESVLPDATVTTPIQVASRPTSGLSPDPCVIRIEAEAPFQAIFGDSIVPLLNLGPITMRAATEERYIGA